MPFPPVEPPDLPVPALPVDLLPVGRAGSLAAFVVVLPVEPPEPPAPVPVLPEPPGPVPVLPEPPELPLPLVAVVPVPPIGGVVIVLPVLVSIVTDVRCLVVGS